MESIANGTDEDDDLYPDVAFTFHKWMTDQMSMKEGTTKTYIKNFKTLFDEDGKSFVSMATQSYFDLVKASPANRRGNGQRSATIGKFMIFWQQQGEKMWREKSGWLKAPPDAALYKVKGITPRAKASKPATSASTSASAATTPPAEPTAPAPPPKAAVPPPAKALTPADKPASVEKPADKPVDKPADKPVDTPTDKTTGKATYKATEKSTDKPPAATPSSAAPSPEHAPPPVPSKASAAEAAGSAAGAGSAKEKPPPIVKTGSWREADPEDQKEVKELLPRFREWLKKSKGKGDEWAASTSQNFGNLFKKQAKPLSVMGSNEFLRHLEGAGRSRPGQMALTSVKWFGHFWTEELGRQLEGTLCDLEGPKPVIAPLQTSAEKDSSMSSMMASLLPESAEDRKRKREELRAEKESKRRREMQELLQDPEEDPPDVSSDTEYPAGDVESFPKVLTVEASGNPKIDGDYRRYRRSSRGRPCYTKKGKRDMYIFWSKKRWRIAKSFGDASCMAMCQDISGSGIVLPSEPYPHPWRVYTTNEEGAEGEKSKKVVSVTPLGMRVYDKEAELELLGSDLCLFARLPVLKEPPGLSQKREVVGGASATQDSGKLADESKSAAMRAGETKQETQRSEASAEKGKQSTAGNDGASSDDDDDARNDVKPGTSSSSEDSDEESSSSESASEKATPAPKATVTRNDQALKFEQGLRQKLLKDKDKPEVMEKQCEKIRGMCSDQASFDSSLGKLGLSISQVRDIVEKLEKELNIPVPGQATAKPKPPAGPPPSHVARGGPMPTPPAGPPPGHRQRAPVPFGAPTTPPEQPEDTDNARFKPPDHRTARPLPSALKSKRPRSRATTRSMISYSDGLTRGDEKGPQLENMINILSHRMQEGLWFHQPGAQVLCDKCQSVCPQSMGMMAGAPGMSQFAQTQFWCHPCVMGER